MIIRKTDGSNDWTFGSGKENYATDEAALAQNIRSRLLSWVGDCFFAALEGVDWRSRLDVGQKDNLVQEVSGVIKRSYGVVGVNAVSVQYSPSRRSVVIEYDIQTIFSPSFAETLKQSIGG